jgi:hypothetical protein
MAEAGQNATPASMAAVASVIRNRLAAGGYGRTPSEIVHGIDRGDAFRRHGTGGRVKLMSADRGQGGSRPPSPVPNARDRLARPERRNARWDAELVGKRLVQAFVTLDSGHAGRAGQEKGGIGAVEKLFLLTVSLADAAAAAACRSRLMRLVPPKAMSAMSSAER